MAFRTRARAHRAGGGDGRAGGTRTARVQISAAARNVCRKTRIFPYERGGGAERGFQSLRILGGACRRGGARLRSGSPSAAERARLLSVGGRRCGGLFLPLPGVRRGKTFGAISENSEKHPCGAEKIRWIRPFVLSRIRGDTHAAGRRNSRRYLSGIRAVLAETAISYAGGAKIGRARFCSGRF